METDAQKMMQGARGEKRRRDRCDRRRWNFLSFVFLSSVALMEADEEVDQTNQKLF